jgi:cytoskeletal protein CcmA (bactofilin family)
MLRSGRNKPIDLKTTDTLIGASTICEGKIMSEASIRIEGQLHGDLECAGDVTIGEQAVVNSSIIARDIIIAGKVKGNVQSRGKLTVTHTGALIGNIDVRSFIIQEGGVFLGTSSMNQPVQAEERPNPKVVDAKAHKQQKEQQAAAGAN